MKIILKKDITKVGKKDDVIEVADGYAVNKLIPQGWAVKASPGSLQRLKEEKQQHEENLKQEALKWLKVKEEIESQTFEIKVKVYKNNINPVTKRQILTTLNENLSTKIDKYHLDKNHVFKLGSNIYKLNLFPKIEALANIVVKTK